MKSSEMKQIVESQRYYLTDLYFTITLIDNEQIKELIRNNIANLWSTNEYLNSKFDLNAKSFEDIVKHGREVVALNKLYSLEYDKDKPN